MFNQPRRSSSSASRQPDHVAKITDSLSISVWQTHDTQTGRVRMHWDVSRIAGSDPIRTYKTLKIESLLEFPSFLARVATGFSQTEAVGPQLRKELLEFAKDMELLAKRRDANGEDRQQHEPEANLVHF